MVEFYNDKSFFEQFRSPMFYVGLLKTRETWLPLCLDSQPGEQAALDTLFVASSQHLMQQTVDRYAQEVPQTERTFVQFLTRDEIRNLLHQYGLENIALIVAEGDALSCGCGCGCG